MTKGKVILIAGIAALAIFLVAFGPAPDHAGNDNTLVIVAAYGPDSLDPGIAYQAISWELQVNAYNGLLAYKKVAGKEGNDLVPDLAEAYLQRAPERTLTAFADCFARLGERGLLNIVEPRVAAEHFAFLVVGRCIDEALFRGGPAVLESVDVHAQAAAGVRVFLAGYGRN